MIYIICGEDIVASRKKLTELLDDKPNIIRLDGKKTTIAELDEALSSGSLFSNSKTIVVENLTKLKLETRVWELLEKFEKDKNADVILWEETDLSKKKFSKNVKVFSFSFPKFYYTFLDSFEPRSKDSLELLQDVLKTLEPEQVLYGIVRRIRQLLIIKSSDYSKFSEFKRMQSWQLSRLKKQASLWSEDQLKKVFLDLAELDEKMKTSSLTMPLAHHLDILLISDLN